MRELNTILLAERERWFLWSPVFFGLGIGVYFKLQVEPPAWLGIALLLLLLIAFLTLRAIRHSNVQALLWIAGVTAVSVSGFAAAQLRTAHVAAAVLEKRTGPVTLTGRVYHVETFPVGSRLTLDRPRISALAPHATPDRVRIRLRGPQPEVSPGNWIQIRAILSPPSPPAMPGSFDFQRRAFFQRIGGIGFSIGKAQILASPPASGWQAVVLGMSQIRRTVSDNVLANLPDPLGGIATALMTGERSAIPEAILQAMRDSGLAHLLAISGLHIGLVAGILFAGLRAVLSVVPLLALRYPIKKWAAAAAIGGAFFYALIAGATLPTQRAFLMVGLALLAVLVDRRGLSIRSVAWAALIILALQPESLLGASFQMSFAAVIALVATYETYRIRRRQSFALGDALPGWSKRVVTYLGVVGLTTLVAGMATAPFAIYHFNRFADYGLAANLIAVPVTALWVMPWAVCAFLLMPFGLESYALVPMSWGIELVIGTATTVAGWPGAVTLVPTLPDWGLVLVILGGLWLCLWRSGWRFYGLAGIAAGLASIFTLSPPDLLIDGKGRLIGARGAGGVITVSSVRAGRFEREIWQRGAAQEGEPDVWPKSGTSVDGRLSCDLEGCLYRSKGKTVAVVFRESALGEDCFAADAILSTVPVRQACRHSHVIDRFDLWRHGGHALWIEEEGIRIESVNGYRGRRPWVLQHPSGNTDTGS